MTPGKGIKRRMKTIDMFFFRPFLEAVEIICVAGLLTCFRNERLPDLYVSGKRFVQSVIEAYSSGTVRDFHPIPF